MSAETWEVLDLNVIIMCVLISYVIGSNNSGNSWSTAYCTRSLSINTALLFGMVFEICGAFVLRYKVENTLDGLFDYSANFSPQEKSFYFFGVTSAEVTGLIFLAVANSYLYPVSSSQITISTMVGMSLVRDTFYTTGKDKVVWFPTLTIIMLVWLFLPFLTLFLSALVYELIKRLVMIGNAKVRSLIITPYLSGAVFVIYFAFSFATKYFHEISFGVKIILAPCIIVAGFFVGMVFKRMHFFVTKYTPTMGFSKAFYHSLFVFNNKPFYEYREKMDEVAEAYKVQKEILVVPDYGSVAVRPQEVEDVEIPRDKSSINALRFSWTVAVMTLNRHGLTTYDRKAYAKSIPGEEDFMVLLILAEIGMSMANGSTNVSNAFLYATDLQVISGTSPWLLVALRYFCAIAMGLGVYLYGDRITKRMGTKFVTYTNTAAFSAQFTAMTITLVSSIIGYPVSTTQTFIFSLLGLSLFNKRPKVVEIDKRMMRNLAIWWVLTVPVCILAPFVFSTLFRCFIPIS